MTDLDPIDQATAHIAHRITQASHIIDARHHNPEAHPEYGPYPTLATIARRALADMLEDGWVPPGGPMTAGEAAQLRRRNRHMRGQA